MRTLTRLLAAATAALVVAACGPAPAGAAATVEGVPISRDLLASEVRTLVGDTIQGDAQQRGAAVGELQRQVLTLMVQAEIIRQLATDRGATIDDAEIEERVTREIENAGGEEALAETLQFSDLTLPLFRDVLVPAQLYLDAIRNQLVEEVAAMETRTVRHILLESQAEADEVVDELVAGGDFGELAEDRSADPGSAARGGDLGPAPRGAYVDAFDEAAWGAELGTVVGPIETQFGFHVLEVTDEGELSTDDMAPAQIDQLVSTDLNELLEEAFRSADVEVGAGLGIWDAEEVRVVPPPAVGEGAPEEGLLPELEDLAEPEGE